MTPVTPANNTCTASAASEALAVSSWNLSGPAVSFLLQSEMPGFWEQYKWYVIIACLIEAMLIAWLLLGQARRRKAERERERFANLARERHRHLNDVISNVPGIVWEALIDPKTNLQKTTFISQHVEKTLGYAPEEFLASPDLCVKLIDDEDRERTMRNCNAVLSSGIEGTTQFRWKTKEGKRLWVEAHISPMVDESGTTIGLHGVTFDISERKSAEEALRDSEESNRAVLRAIPDLMFLQTRDGVYLECHAKSARDLPVPLEGLIGKNMRDVLPADLAEDFFHCFERAYDTSEPQILEYSLVIDETDRWFEARVVTSGDKFLSIVRDVTSRKFTEEALTKNEAQLSGIIDSAMDGIITIDQSQRVVLFNSTAEKIFGCSAADALGQSIERFIPERLREALAGHNGTQRPMEVLSDLHGLRYSGEKFPLEASVSQVEVHGQKLYTVILRDITERQVAQQAVRESEARFRHMADTVPVMIWMSDQTKFYTYFNQQWLDFTGKTMESELGKGWAKGVHPDDRERCLEVYEKSFDSRMHFEMEHRLRRADGQYRWVLNCGTPRFSSDGDFLGYIGSCIDVTERKESEVALRTAHEELKQLKNQLEAENIYLQQQLQLDQTASEIVGQSDAIKYMLAKISQVAPTDSSVLITGETGTGKELVATAIHGSSLRKDRPLIKVNCAALSASLIESELFGHEKGAFTGAASRKLGRFELADGGSIFLDEIGELGLDLQVKLLRVIQEGEFERVGGSKTIKVDVRIIAATNRNLRQEVEKGTFREDLWYRLNVFPITAPPLRQRKDDIPLLVEYFVGKYAKKAGKRISSVSPRVMQSLQDHQWPGNVRELANVIERAVIHTQGSVLQLADRFEQTPGEPAEISSMSLEDIERSYIIRVLENTGWRIEGPNGAAKILGLNASTLRARMIKLGIQRPRATVG